MTSPVVSGQSTSASANGGLSNAEKLMQKHEEAHKTTIEDVPDEEDLASHPQPESSSILESTDENSNAPGWTAPISAKAAGKQKAESTSKENAIDTQSSELFPDLAGVSKSSKSSAPIWAKKAPVANGDGTPTNGSSTPKSGANTPANGAPRKTPNGGLQSLAGQIAGPVYVFDPKELPRSATKKPLPEILRDVNKKFRTNLTQTTGEGGVIKISATGTQSSDAAKNQAFKELGSQFNTVKEIEVPFPKSARAHLIGKGGATIKSLQEASGARIQTPKADDTPESVDDDDDMIKVTIKGNPIAIRMARESVAKIASERSVNTTAKLRNIPAELYPFIAGPNNSSVNAMEEAHGVDIGIPSYHIWTSQPPPQVPEKGEAPAFIPAASDNHITLAGDRAAIQAARAEIEQLSQTLQRQLTLAQVFGINNGRHQFVIGDKGIPAEEFFAKTGCAIILPGNSDVDEITIIGPANKIQAAEDRAMDLATEMNNSTFDLVKQLRSVQAPREHARNVTHYLLDRGEIKRLQQLHDAHIVTAFDSTTGHVSPWELYSRDGKNAIKAQSEINRILEAHPPSRMTTLDIDSFFHQHLAKEFLPRVKSDFGVHLVLPSLTSVPAPVVLVYEGEDEPESEYQIPRGRPSATEVNAFQQTLTAARKHILDVISAQGQIIARQIDVPQIFHPKLKNYIKKENLSREAGQFPVRVSSRGTVLTFSGPNLAVESLVAKVEAFVEQAKEDEKERGFTLSFDFPQKHANQLIGKGGSNIGELREKFDVEIQVNDGKVELKGPKAKAEAAKSHITALGKQWADEASYILKIEPKFHSELIGAKGAQIKRLEDRYANVQIRFPHSARPARDDNSNDAASEAGRKTGRREQEPDEVVVRGPKKSADGARDEILSLLQWMKDNSFTATVSVQAGQIPSLIGQRGAEMDKVRQETGAKIDIPNARDIKDPSTRVEIQIKGTKSQVAQAKEMIEQKKEVFDQTVTKTLEVEKRHHRALIGSKGATINDIVTKSGGSNTSGQTVQFPKADADGNVIKITGTVEVVDKIIATIEKMVAEWESQTVEVIEVPTDKHRSLIGRGGEAKKDLESKFKVSIDIPRQGSEQTGVKITGLPTDVENAKSHILNLVKEQEGEVLKVPKKVHHAVSDNGQFLRQLRNSHKVIVDVSRNDVPPKPVAQSKSTGAKPLITDEDEAAAGAHEFSTSEIPDIDGEIPWVLRGTPENVVKARAAIIAAIEQALQNSTIGYLTLADPQTYRFVIGQGGSKVNSIRKATGCKITVPRDQAKDEPIEIVGSTDGVEKARDLILQAVEDGRNGIAGRA